jgi:hypothetical protein
VHHRSCWCVGGDVGACRCRLTKCGCSARRCTAAKLRGGGRDVGRRRERRHNGDFRGLWAIRINRAKASMFDSGSSTWSTFFILIYSKYCIPSWAGRDKERHAMVRTQGALHGALWST